LLYELIPKISVIGDQLEILRQSEMMPMRGEQLRAKAVNRAEESAIECVDHLRFF
jgi:hypothetical protein